MLFSQLLVSADVLTSTSATTAPTTGKTCLPFSLDNMFNMPSENDAVKALWGPPTLSPQAPKPSSTTVPPSSSLLQSPSSSSHGVGLSSSGFDVPICESRPAPHAALLAAEPKAPTAGTFQAQSAAIVVRLSVMLFGASRVLHAFQLLWHASAADHGW